MDLIEVWLTSGGGTLGGVIKGRGKSVSDGPIPANLVGLKEQGWTPNKISRWEEKGLDGVSSREPDRLGGGGLRHSTPHFGAVPTREGTPGPGSRQTEAKILRWF